MTDEMKLMHMHTPNARLFLELVAVGRELVNKLDAGHFSTNEQHLPELGTGGGVCCKFTSSYKAFTLGQYLEVHG